MNNQIIKKEIEINYINNHNELKIIKDYHYNELKENELSKLDLYKIHLMKLYKKKRELEKLIKNQLKLIQINQLKLLKNEFSSNQIENYINEILIPKYHSYQRELKTIETKIYKMRDR